MRHGFVVLAALSLITAGCNSGPQPPKPGSPAFFWAAAQSTHAAGDFQKTSDNLSQLNNTEYAVRAQPWSIAISAGLAKGYLDLADTFDAAARMNRANPAPFRRQSAQFRSLASNATMLCVETTHQFLLAPKADQVALEFPYPAGSAAEPVQLQRVAKGMLPTPAVLEDLQKDMLQRGVFRSVAEMVGSPNDTGKALEVFKAAHVNVARSTFLTATGNALYQLADLYTRQKLDQPERLNLVCDQATAALQAVPETKATKELMAKIAKLRKPQKRT